MRIWIFHPMQTLFSDRIKTSFSLSLNTGKWPEIIVSLKITALSQWHSFWVIPAIKCYVLLKFREVFRSAVCLETGTVPIWQTGMFTSSLNPFQSGPIFDFPFSDRGSEDPCPITRYPLGVWSREKLVLVSYYKIYNMPLLYPSRHN